MLFYLFLFIFLSYKFLSDQLHKIEIRTKIKYIMLYLIKVLLMSYLIFNVFIYSVFNSISYLTAEEKPKIYQRCKIVDVTSSVRNYAIYYEFKNRVYRVAEYSSRVGTLSRKDDYSNYYLILSIRKGIFDTYRVDSWDIVSE